MHAPALLLLLASQASPAPTEETAAPPPLSVAAGGELLVVCTGTGTLERLDAASGERLGALPAGFSPHEVTVAPGGALAVVANYGDKQRASRSLEVYDLAAGERLRTIDLGEYAFPHALAFLDAGREVLVTAETNGMVLDVDIESGEVLRAMETGGRTPNMLVLSPERDRAYVSNMWSANVTVLDLELGEPLMIIETDKGPEGLALSPDGSELWVAHRGSEQVVVIDTEALEVVAKIPSGVMPSHAAFSPDGRRVAVTCVLSGELRIYDAEARQQLFSVPMKLREGDDPDEATFGSRFGQSAVPIGVTIDPFSQYAYVAASRPGRIEVVELATGEIVRSWPTGQHPDGVVWNTRPRADASSAGD